MSYVAWPNRITMTRILLVGPFVIALLHLQDPVWHEWARWGALSTFGLMALSDGLDGYLARRLHAESAIGRFLDPLADKLLILCSVVLLAHDGTHVQGVQVPSTVAVIAVGKDLIIVVGFCIIYFATNRTYIDPRGSGKWCTTTQLLMIIFILLYPNLPVWLRPVPRILWWIASVLAVVTVIHYYRLGRRFIARHETPANSEDHTSRPA